MNDAERLQQIYAIAHGWEHSRRGGSSLAHDRLTLARIRTILDDVPSVEWTTEPQRVIGITRNAEIVITPDGPREPPGHRILITGLVEDPEWADVYVLGDLASAQRRAVALYVALRGVT